VSVSDRLEAGSAAVRSFARVDWSARASIVPGTACDGGGLWRLDWVPGNVGGHGRGEVSMLASRVEGAGLRRGEAVLARGGVPQLAPPGLLGVQLHPAGPADGGR